MKVRLNHESSRVNKIQTFNLRLLEVTDIIKHAFLRKGLHSRNENEQF